MFIKVSFRFLFFTFLFLYLSETRASWFDEQSLDATVLIEKRQTIAEFTKEEYSLILKAVPGIEQILRKGVKDETEHKITIDVTKISEEQVEKLSKDLYNEIRRRAPYRRHGVGILFHSHDEEGRLIVITCKHIVEKPVIYVTVAADSNFLRYITTHNIRSLLLAGSVWEIDNEKLRCRVETQKDGHPIYVAHPDLDIAAFKLGLATGAKIGGKAREITNIKFISNKWIRYRKDVSNGDEVYFVGFPFGIGSDVHISPVIRSGSLSWMPPNSRIFLLDAFSYGGNSGSPIFAKKLLEPINKGIKWVKPKFIGMVFGHLGQEYENYGLAQCVWSDDILTVVKKAKSLK